ncbi:unnamed protein product [Polarella glacialis]|nr:unnamed protein product [Polarella glacialis]
MRPDFALLKQTTDPSDPSEGVLLLPKDFEKACTVPSEEFRLGLHDEQLLHCRPDCEPVQASMTEAVGSIGSQAGFCNYKGQLIQTLHQYLGRNLGVGDLLWSYRSEGGQFIASVEVLAASLPEVEGAACATKKAAEQSAASKAIEQLQMRPDFTSLKQLTDLIELSEGVLLLPKDFEKACTVPAEEFRLGLHDEQLLHCRPDCEPVQASMTEAVGSIGSQAGFCNYKGQLIQTLHQHLGRNLGVGDLLWSYRSEGGQFIASVEVLAASLPEVEGAACATKKAAEQSAASKAIEQLQMRPDFALLKQTTDPSELSEGVLPLPTKVAIAGLPFHCIVQILREQSVWLEARSGGSCGFPSQQAAKESASWQACWALSQKTADGLIRATVYSSSSRGVTRREKLALGPGWHGELREFSAAGGQRCAKLRVSRGWSQQVLAERLSQPLGVVQQLEALGLMPAGPVIAALNKLFGETLPRGGKPVDGKLRGTTNNTTAGAGLRQPGLCTLGDFMPEFDNSNDDDNNDNDNNDNNDNNNNKNLEPLLQTAGENSLLEAAEAHE